MEEDKNKKPNGISWFALGFSIAAFIFNAIVLILKLKQ